MQGLRKKAMMVITNPKNQRKNDGSADFILFRFCVVSVVVRRVVCHGAKITDSSAFIVAGWCNPLCVGGVWV